MRHMNRLSPGFLPLNQIAFAVLDLRRTEAWWREGLGFLPAGGTRALFRGPLSGRIQKLPGSACTCWCLLGRNDWCQLELFQYEKPVSQLMPADYRPSDLGYSRCGVWVADFDATLARLARLGSEPLAAPVGVPGQRRACVRNPDGVYVELMEDDPLPAQNARGRQDCPVAIRSATLSTPDMDASVDFLTRGLGMREVPRQLHEDAHEALWGLAGARCERRVFSDGSAIRRCCSNWCSTAIRRAGRSRPVTACATSASSTSASATRREARASWPCTARRSRPARSTTARR